MPPPTPDSVIDTDRRRTAAALRLLRVVGVALVVSGAAHVGVWLVDGGAWAGPVSWPKPIVVGPSTESCPS